MLHKYNIAHYPFKALLCNLIDTTDLEHIHELGGFENLGNTPGNDNNSFWHRRFYDRMKDSHFINCYLYFIANEITKHFDEGIIYQKYPTVRFQIPNGKGVAGYHIDTEYNHPAEETNIWLPFTHAKDSASIYIESEPGKKDYTPQDVKYGEYIMFAGGKLSHGNEINTTSETRVSIDMRVIPISKYRPSDMKGLAYGKIRSTEGENAYYGML